MQYSITPKSQLFRRHKNVFVKSNFKPLYINYLKIYIKYLREEHTNKKFSIINNNDKL